MKRPESTINNVVKRSIKVITSTKTRVKPTGFIPKAFVRHSGWRNNDFKLDLKLFTDWICV